MTIDTMSNRCNAASLISLWVGCALSVLMLAGCARSPAENESTGPVAEVHDYGYVAEMVAARLREKQSQPPRQARRTRRSRPIVRTPRTARRESPTPSPVTPPVESPRVEPRVERAVPTRVAKLERAKTQAAGSDQAVGTESLDTKSAETESVEMEPVAREPIALPPVTSAPREGSVPPEAQAAAQPPVAVLLPPQRVPQTPEIQSVAEPSESIVPTPGVTPSDVPPLATGERTEAKLGDVAAEKIRNGYALAERGALYAARQEFIQVLRMISRAKDAQSGTSQRSQALAAGLRALDEAEDFAPRGTQLEADLDVAIITSAHRTPVAQQASGKPLLPQQWMDRYYRYAQVKLSEAVMGDPAGSMALHALGKLHRHQGEMEPAGHPLAHRRAFVYQQAALLAHDNNHLAAHELAVLLADAGHYAQAEQLLQQVARREPHPVVYRNLALVQKKQGYFQRAANSEQHAMLLAQTGNRGNRQVQWVTPAEFAQAGDSATRGLPTQPLPARQQIGPQQRIRPAPNPAMRVADGPLPVTAQATAPYGMNLPPQQPSPYRR